MCRSAATSAPPCCRSRSSRPAATTSSRCSSYQIDLARSVDATVGILLNITPDHLDRHGTIENYAAVKARLVRAAQAAVVGVDDAYCRAIADELREHRGGKRPSQVMRLSTRPDAECDIGVDGRRIVLKRDGGITEIADLTGIGSLRGAHNAENACAAGGRAADAARAADAGTRSQRG